MRRALHVVGAVLGTTATVLVATVGGAFLHINLPAGRRLLAGGVTGALSDLFQGKMAIERLGHFGLGGLDGAVLTLTGPDGKRLLLLQGVRARISLPRVAWSVLAGKGDMKVGVRELSVDYVDAVLEQDQAGNFTIVKAFDPKNPTPAKPKDPNARGLDLDLPRIDIRHAWVHGGIQAVPIVDADLDALDGAFGMTPKKTQLDLRHFALNTRNLPQHADMDGAIEAHLVLPAADVGDPNAMLAALTYVGKVGGIDATVNGKLAGKQVDAVVDVPHADPDALQRMSAPIYEPASVHLEAHGAMPTIIPAGEIHVGAGVVTLGGRIDLADEHDKRLRAKATVNARDIDLRAFSPTGPASKIAVDTEASAVVPPGGDVEGRYAVHVSPSAIAGQAVPETRVRGTFTKTSVAGDADIDEPGAPTTLAFAMRTDTMALDFDAKSRARSLATLPQLGDGFAGSARLEAKGHLDLRAQTVTALATAQVDDFAAGGASTAHATLAAEVRGPLRAPNVSANVAGSKLRAGGYTYGAFAVTAVGPATSPFIGVELQHGENAPNAVVHAKVDATHGVRVDGAKVTLQRDKDQITASVASVTSQGGTLRVEGLTVEGAGDPLKGEVTMRGGDLRVKASTPGFDVGRLAHVLYAERFVQGGRLALDVDLKATRTKTDGHVTFDLSGAQSPYLRDTVRTHLDAKFDGKRVDAKGDLDLGEAARVDVALEQFELAGGALRPASWKRGTGTVRLDGNVDLDRLNQVLPEDVVPVNAMAGRLTLRGSAKLEHERLPDLDLEAQTQDFVMTARPKTERAQAGNEFETAPPLHVDGIDAHVKVAFEGSSGKTALQVQLFDKLATLVGLDAKASPDETAFARGKYDRDFLLGTPIEARLEVPRRALGRMPKTFGELPMAGDVAFLANVRGTARDPRLMMKAQAFGLYDKDETQPVPITGDAVVTYDGENVRTQIVALRPEGKVVDAFADMHIRAKDLVDGKGPPAWEASARADITRFPLEVIGDYLQVDVKGDLNGKVELKDLHKAGALTADFSVKDAIVGDVPLPRAGASVTLKDGRLEARARMDQKAGYLEASATTGMTWGAAVAPTMASDAPFDAGLKAENFRLAFLAPFVEKTVSDLDGRLDANVKAHFDGGMKNPKFDGAILLDQGRFESAVIGEELHNVHARVTLQERGKWAFEDISAEGITGKVTASGSAEMDGFTFKQAKGAVRIARSEKLPITAQEMSLGKAWGAIDVTARSAANGKRIDMDIDIPSFHLELPESTPHAVQPMDPNPDILIGQRLKDGDFIAKPLGPGDKPEEKPSSPPTQMNIAVKLGKDVEVRRTTMLRATIVGNPVIHTGETTAMNGEVRVPRGYIVIQGRKFTIEKATVTFDGQPPGDPVVVATATYEAEDGTRVIADFRGPVKTGKLTLSSEPALSQNEILAVLLYGTATGSFGSGGGGGNNSVAAQGVAAGYLTQGLNKAISGVSSLDISTRVDTSQSQNPRPEVEIALSHKVSATIIRSLGVPPPGQNPDLTLLDVDWRFAPKWTASSTIGDHGTSIFDLTWKYRF